MASSSAAQPWELDWLEWAYPIARTAIDQPELHSELRTLTGSKSYPHDEERDPASDPSLYWPGVVGPRWAPERSVLFVGSIHADFLAGTTPASPSERYTLVRSMTDANRAWREAPRTRLGDIAYLSATRNAYLALVPGWKRDAQFALVRQHLQDDVAEVAWTNLAHGRALSENPNEYKLQLACSSRKGANPIGPMIEALRPLAIVSCVKPLSGSHRSRYDLTCSDGWQPSLFTYNGRTGKRDGQDPIHWTQLVANEIRSLRTAG